VTADLLRSPAGHIGGAKKLEESGHLIMAGALANPVDGGKLRGRSKDAASPLSFSVARLTVSVGRVSSIDAAIFLFKGLADEEIKKFVEADPYVVNGLVTDWKIRDWTAVVGTGQL
jgi:uncharacterized protein YciI